MESSTSSTLSFYRDNPHWMRTIYVVGLPRSGKTTILNLLGSCKNVETAEEPFELSLIAQKSSLYENNPKELLNQMDSYLALMENLFCEIAIGRRVNYRKQDLSYVKLQKTKNLLTNRHKLNTRKQLLMHLNSNQTTFAVSLNEAEGSLNFITSKVPNPIVIFMENKIERVLDEINFKHWLSDESLTTQADLTPAYKFIKKFLDKNFYVPYLVSDLLIRDFLNSSERERAVLYTLEQKKRFESSINSLSIPVFKIDFSKFIRDPLNQTIDLISQLDLVPTRLMFKQIKRMKRKSKNWKI